MFSDKQTARIAGVLFITATLASILSVPFLAPINSSDYLAGISANENQILTGVFLSFIAAIASASIAISLYPVLRRYSEGLALGAVGFRLIEGAFYILALIPIILLISLSQEFAKAGAPTTLYFQTLDVLLLAAYHWAGNVASLIAFSLGASAYYYIFYQSKFIPRWLSGWGLLGATLTLIAGILVLFDLISPMSAPQIVLALPIAVQEMVLAVWLIVKGFKLPRMMQQKPD